ncbi:DUF922 domain-containing protein [Aureimonas sp. SK2]|uniref:DUF922 domain-containing protein n=1 Tax=Aureimonas sp. SK2 TaxID=3015992 RepID=UPI0024452D41|nr:DUF922 domain-containing protein [Aureimonas sp. SK2]
MIEIGTGQGPRCEIRAKRDGRLRRTTTLAILIVVGLLAGACTTTSQVSTRYYDVTGATARDLERGIRRKGPQNGKAVAMAGISFRPVTLETAVGDGGCRFRRARFRVNADLTLPRWREAARSRDAALQRNWKGFAAYARAHEEAHVKIAEAFAKALEQAFLAIPPQPSCARLEAVGIALIRRAMPAHERAQLAFDESEKRRLARLMAQAERQRR